MRAGTPSSGLLLRPIKDWVHGFWCYTMAKTWINFRMSLITGLLDVNLLEKVWSVTWVAETRFFFVLILPKWGWSSWSHGLTEELLHHLNGVRPTIKFTVEQEENGTLPFLNTLLRRREDGSQFNIIEVFKSGWTLRSMLTKMKLFVSNPMWYIVSPTAVARSTSERLNADWRRDWRNTEMPVRGGWWRSWSMCGRTNPDSLGGDHSTGPWQEGAVGEGGPAHPDDTLG